MNGKPVMDPALLSKYRAAHWMGREKPWGVRVQNLHNQTYGTFRRTPRDEMSLPIMNQYWLELCEDAMRSYVVSNGLSPALIDCRTSGGKGEISGG